MGSAHGPAAHNRNSSGIAKDDTAPELLCRLLDLPAELLVAIATQLAEVNQFAASLACRKLRVAVAGTERRAAGTRLSTRIGSALDSVDKLERAASCGMPLSAKLFTRAAWHGQVEPLRWLRTHGCVCEPHRAGRQGTCSSVAEGGRLSVLQWARADGSPWGARTCSCALVGRHLARSTGLTPMERPVGCVDRRCCSYGQALAGCAAVPLAPRANGCPWNERKYVRHTCA
jgi:hypothetical protein